MTTADPPVPTKNLFWQGLFRSVGMTLLVLGLATFAGLCFSGTRQSQSASATQIKIFWLSQVIAGVGTGMLCRSREATWIWGFLSPVLGLFYWIVIGEIQLNETLFLWTVPFHLIPLVLTEPREWKSPESAGEPRQPRYLVRAFGLAPLGLTSPIAFAYGVGALNEARRRNEIPTWAVAATAWAALWMLIPIGMIYSFRTVAPAPVLNSTPVKQIVRGEGIEAELLAGWRDASELRTFPSCILAVARPEQELYLIAVEVPKKNLVSKTLADYTKVNVETMRANFKPFRGMLGPRDVALGGLPAFEHRLEGGLQGYEVTMLVVAAERPESFVHVRAWTTTSEFDRSSAELKDAIARIRFVRP